MNTRRYPPSVLPVAICLVGSFLLPRLQAEERRGADDQPVARTATSPVVPTAQRRAVEFARLKALARSKGEVMVIVELDVPNGRALTAKSIAATRRPGAAQADAQLAAAIDATTQRELAKLAGIQHKVNRTYRAIPFLALTVSERALTALEASPAILSINEDRLARPSLDNTVNITGASDSWNAGYDGAGWHVAILDTGIRSTHEFFAGKDILEACFSAASHCPNGLTSDFGPGSAQHYPSNYVGWDHGTHVTGIATGNAPGVPLYGIARGADIIAIQVFSKFDDGCQQGSTTYDCVRSYSSDQTAGLDYLYTLRNTYDISSANMSIGGGEYTNQTDCDSNHVAQKAAIDLLRSIGVATVIAAGNESFCGSLAGPGCISSAVSVGAVTDSDVEASFSNWHSYMLDLYAPGVAVLSAWADSDSSYISYSGTSMATPHVAGTWAILKQAQPTASVQEIFELLDATGQPVTGRAACTPAPTQRRIQIDAALSYLAPVQSCTPQKLVASDGTDGDEFGYAAALSGDVAAVGSRLDDENGAGAGAVYVYTRNGTTFDNETKLAGSDTAAGDEFGTSVAAEGDLLLVGAPGNTHSSLTAAGAAYVLRFDGSTWAQETKLTAPTDAGAGDRFGRAVALDGSVAVIGAFADDDGAEDAGSAYVFRFDGSSWQFEQKLTAFDPGTFDNFGRAVAASGNVVAVAAPNNDGAASGAGAVYVYRWDGSTWSLDDKLTASDAATSDRFGHSVALDGDDLLIAAPNDDDVESNAGSVYHFAWDGSAWSEQQQFYAPDPAATDQFGQDVRLSGGTAIVAAHLHEHAVNNAGAVYMFHHAPPRWVFSTELLAPDAAELDQLGYALGYDNGIILAGARWHDAGALDKSGAAYLMPVGDCDGSFVADYCEIEVDSNLDQNDNALIDACECTPSSPPELAELSTPSGNVPFTTNRYLPVRILDTDGVDRLIRVQALQLPAPLQGTVFEGQIWWVGTPFRICEKANEPGSTNCSTVPGQPKGRQFNWYAPLVCDQALAAPIQVGTCQGGVCVGGFADGDPCGRDVDCQVLYLEHEGIVPSLSNRAAIYEVATLGSDCAQTDPSSYSAPLTINQDRLGDFADLGSQCETPAGGNGPGSEDINAITAKFSNASCQVKKARCDITRVGGGAPDHKCDSVDINAVLQGFQNPSSLPWAPVNPSDACSLGAAEAE